MGCQTGFTKEAVDPWDTLGGMEQKGTWVTAVRAARLVDIQ